MVSRHVVLKTLVGGGKGGVVRQEVGSAIEALNDLVTSAVEVIATKILFVF